MTTGIPPRLQNLTDAPQLVTEASAGMEHSPAGRENILQEPMYSFSDHVVPLKARMHIVVRGDLQCHQGDVEPALIWQCYSRVEPGIYFQEVGLVSVFLEEELRGPHSRVPQIFG
jgi:hypothetical protein